MLNSMKLCLFYIITLLEIAVLVIGTDYDAANTLNGNMAPIQIQNQDINQAKDQAVPVSNFLQNTPNLAPTSFSGNENYKRNARELMSDEKSILNSQSSMIQDNFLKDNANRNVREVTIDTNNFDKGSIFDTNNFDKGSIFDTKNLNGDVGLCHKENIERNAREVFDTDSPNRFDTGSIFDKNISDEDTEQRTCLRENPDRNIREVSDSGSMISSNILDSLKDTCLDENLKRNARQVIDSSPMVNSNILNPSVQDLEQGIATKELTLNSFNEGVIPDYNRNIREILDVGSGEGSKVVENQDDIPQILDKLGVSSNIVSEASLLDGNQNSETDSKRDVRDNEQISNKNLKEVESNYRNIRGVDDIKQVLNQNLKSLESNRNFDENNYRIVRGVDNTSPIEPAILNQNLINLESNLKIDENSHRILREIDGEGSKIDNLRHDSLTEDSNELGSLSNLQKITKSDSFEDETSLINNVRNSREIIGNYKMDLKKLLEQNNRISSVDKNLEIPSSYASNSEEILKGNVERNARDIQGPSLLLNSEVLNQNMDENEGKYVGNNQIIVEGEVQRNARDLQDSSLKDSGIFIQNINENGGENFENSQRSVREAFSVSEKNMKSGDMNIRGVSNENEMLESNILEQNSLNSGLNFENLVEIPENLDPSLFNDDESLVENNMRNIREVGDENPLEDASNFEKNKENFERKIRGISDGSEKFDSNASENIDEHRSIRDIPDLSENSDLQVSNEDNIKERNIREIPVPDSSEKLDLEVSNRDENIEEGRSIRDIPEEPRMPPLSNVLSQEAIDNIREISGDYQKFESVTEEANILENRNIREISEEYRTALSNDFNQETIDNLRNIREISGDNKAPNLISLDQGTIVEGSRNIREISVENSSFKSNSINQELITDVPRNIREISVGNSGFNSGIYKQEPTIIGENRNVREISSENTGVYQKISQQEPVVIGGDRIVRDINSDESKAVEASSLNRKDVNGDEVGEEFGIKREARSCKKKNSHHKNNTSDEFVEEKSAPVRASLSMMNLRIVKSKDDSKFLDDATDSSENTGGENEGKKKKKKICRVKHLHVLQPLKKGSKILESPRKKENNLRNLTTGSRGTILKVLKATLDKNEGEEEEGGEGEEEGVEDEERELEEESGMRRDEEEGREVDESNTKTKSAKKSKLNFDRNNLKNIKDRGRLEGRIISSPLVAENVPKRVFGGSKKFVLSESRPQNFVSKNRKSLFKKERLKNDEPTFLVGLEIKKDLKKDKEEEENENNDDSDDDIQSAKIEDNIDEPCQSMVGTPSNFERLKLKDLQNFSEAINVSDSSNKRKKSENKLNNFDKKLDNNFGNKLNNFDKVRADNIDKNRDTLDRNLESDNKPEVLGEEEEEEGGGGGEEEEEKMEEEEEEEEDRGLKKRERNDANDGEENENAVEMGNDEFEENMDVEGNNNIDENSTY